MKKQLLIAWLAGVGWLLGSCGNSGAGFSAGADTSHATTENAAGADSTTGKNDSATVQSVHIDTADIAFIKKAAKGGMLEVSLGNLAQQNGNSPRVKFFGEMMIKDHTDANDKLHKLAGQASITLPDSSMVQADHHRTALVAKKGAAFDKAYMKMMIEDHQEDIADFQKAANGKTEPVKTFAAQTLPVLTKHLDSAKAILSALH